MKTMATLFACLVLASGCFPLRNQSIGEKGSEPWPVSPPPPVTADRITRDNSHQMAQALYDEFDREAQQTVVTSPPPIGPHPPPKR